MRLVRFSCPAGAGGGRLSLRPPEGEDAGRVHIRRPDHVRLPQRLAFTPDQRQRAGPLVRRDAPGIIHPHVAGRLLGMREAGGFAQRAVLPQGEERDHVAFPGADIQHISGKADGADPEQGAEILRNDASLLKNGSV